MSRPDEHADNPFSTRRIRPGALPFIFPPGESVEVLVERLRQNDWCGEIIGRHGSGKSTLLATLVAAIERAGRPTVLITLHDRERRLPLVLRTDARLHTPAVVIVDGYEQLSRWNRFALKRFCRRRAIGLLVTAHESMGLPAIYHTVATPDIACRVVGELMRDREPLFDSEQVLEVLSLRHGDLRETLFGLYDLYEVRRAATTAREKIKDKA